MADEKNQHRMVVCLMRRAKSFMLSSFSSGNPIGTGLGTYLTSAESVSSPETEPGRFDVLQTESKGHLQMQNQNRGRVLGFNVLFRTSSRFFPIKDNQIKPRFRNSWLLVWDSDIMTNFKKRCSGSSALSRDSSK